jgi:hypothetical protein
MSQKPSQLLEEILEFVDHASGLSSNIRDGGEVSIHQSCDGKTFTFDSKKLAEVLRRTDADGNAFIQINFNSGHKVLFTDTLVGFKPRETFGLDMTKIPRVVTTPDLVSVYEAIEESMSADMAPDHEVEILKKVYWAILQGGESAGFDLDHEKEWLGRLLSPRFKASA